VTFLQQAVHHPRKLWLRKAVFQVHLWAGLLLTLYIVVIALTGSILVFEDELRGTTLPAAIARDGARDPLPIPDVVTNVLRAYPEATVNSVTVPTRDVPAYLIEVKLRGGRVQTMIADPASGTIYTQKRTWVQWVHDLHIYLLLNPAYGMQVNAAGAAVLLPLTVTGLMLWWPGLRVWSRGMRVNVRANWRRMNYDLHSAIGFWTLLLVFWWALSGVYFGFYRQVSATVNAVFPLRNMVAPAGGAVASPGTRVPLATVLQAAQDASPHAHLFSISNVSRVDDISYASMDLGAPGDFLHRDIVRIDATSGRVISVWHYAEKHSIGDWVMWLMHPLHFGTLWGMGVKILWAVLGVLLGVLAVSGVVMYWNRALRHMLRRA
jgi:uncharacterized iron-regulated membrane protein